MIKIGNMAVATGIRIDLILETIPKFGNILTICYGVLDNYIF